MSRVQLLKLVIALGPAADLVSGWDKNLPYHAEIELNGPILVLAKCSNRYVISVVIENTVRSTVVSSQITDAEIVDAAAFFKEWNEFTTLNRSNRSSPQETNGGGSQPALANTGSLFNSDSRPAQNSRDPNAPPGFEDEHRLAQPRRTGPNLSFNPDSDIYPPGGRHPQLRSFDPLGSGCPEGMVPPSFGSSKPPNIREDPTHPFETGRRSPCPFSIGPTSMGPPAPGTFGPYGPGPY